MTGHLSLGTLSFPAFHFLGEDFVLREFSPRNEGQEMTSRAFHFPQTNSLKEKGRMLIEKEKCREVQTPPTWQKCYLLLTEINAIISPRKAARKGMLVMGGDSRRSHPFFDYCLHWKHCVEDNILFPFCLRRNRVTFEKVCARTKYSFSYRRKSCNSF